MLAAVCCHYNPCGFRAPVVNYRRFREAFKGCPLITVEVSFNGQFLFDSDWKLNANNTNILWQKEQLLNFAIERLPDRYNQVAWIDADLLFLNPNWASETSMLLSQKPVVQLYENIHYADNKGRLIRIVESLASRYNKGTFGVGQPGGAWAARRELIQKHSIYRYDLCGGGDCRFTDAITGVSNGFSVQVSTPEMNAHTREWAANIFIDVRGQLGCTSGDIIHLYHGSRDNRQYSGRTTILQRHSYDPAVDVRVGKSGLLEWCTRKPELHREVRDYFLSRQEDE